MSEKNGRIILDVAYQPQVRTTKDTCRLMLDVIIALIPAIIVGVLQFGLYPLLLLLTGVCSAVFWEWGYRRLFKKEASIGDLSAVLTGLLLALTMPPTAPWWLPVIGTFFGIVVVKQLYGGIGKNFLNPALAGPQCAERYHRRHYDGDTAFRHVRRGPSGIFHGEVHVHGLPSRLHR